SVLYRSTRRLLKARESAHSLQNPASPLRAAAPLAGNPMPNVTEPRLQSRSRTETEQQRRVLQVAKLVSATVGNNFFSSLTEHLAKALGGDCVYVAETVGGRLPRLRTVAVYRNGGPAAGFEQDLSGSGAGQVITDGLFAWTKEVRQLFPADPLLEELAAEGYVGISLADSAGQVIGLIALIGKAP